MPTMMTTDEAVRYVCKSAVILQSLSSPGDELCEFAKGLLMRKRSHKELRRFASAAKTLTATSENTKEVLERIADYSIFIKHSD